MLKSNAAAQSRIEENTKRDEKRHKYNSPEKEPDLQRGSGGEN